MASPCALAVDVGGTKLAVGVVDQEGHVLRSVRAPTPRGEAEAVFDALAALVASVADGSEVVCGVGCGGPMSAGGADVSPLNIPAWRGFPLRSRLTEMTGLTVFVDNDAKALALGEGWRGAASGVDDYIAMVVSTGVGGGIVLGGRLLDGAAGNAGHVGHLIVVPDGRLCACGASGCLEAEASGTAIGAATGRPAAEAGPDVVVRTGTLVGRAVASVANLLDLRLAVVGGSVALGFGDLFFAAARAELARSARLSFSSGARIVPAGLGALGPLVGAAAVGWRGLNELLPAVGGRADPAGGGGPAGGDGSVAGDTDADAAGTATGGPVADDAFDRPGSGVTETVEAHDDPGGDRRSGGRRPA